MFALNAAPLVRVAARDAEERQRAAEEEKQKMMKQKKIMAA